MIDRKFIQMHYCQTNIENGGTIAYDLNYLTNNYVLIYTNNFPCKYSKFVNFY